MRKGPGFETKSLSGARRKKGQALRPRPYLEPDAERAKLWGQGLIQSQRRKGPNFEDEGSSGARHEKGQDLAPKAYLEANFCAKRGEKFCLNTLLNYKPWYSENRKDRT